MNIKDAKNEIIHTVWAYLKKNENGEYRYPRIRQRPILLMGPPGIGKSAIVEQAAKECQVGFVSYTMTHHTRQSAVGLPKIVSRKFGDNTVDITEYTMSEIIASVYNTMEKTGKKEGILFLDEINCVSETLAPAMLQFLQNKTFGTHKVPEGWVIVAAGNPPAYNKSVREFDIVTLDRVRKIEIEANCEVWFEYARERQIHGGILSYLRMKKDAFYQMDSSADEKSFVTARGWEDLSELLKSYEDLELEPGEEVIFEFLQKEETAREFADYYHLYQKYKSDYRIFEILAGTLEKQAYEEICQMAGSASIAEQFMITEMVCAEIGGQAVSFWEEDEKKDAVCEMFKRLQLFWKGQEAVSSMETFLQEEKRVLKAKMEGELLTEPAAQKEKKRIRFLELCCLRLKEEHIVDSLEGSQILHEQFAELCAAWEKKRLQTAQMMEQAVLFIENCFGEGSQLMLLETEMTENDTISKFIAEYGCAPYFAHSSMLLYKRREKLLEEACEKALKKEKD